MTIHEFIQENYEELYEIIRADTGSCRVTIDEEEIEMWIMNEEGLYNWAIESGVDV